MSPEYLHLMRTKECSDEELAVTRETSPCISVASVPANLMDWANTVVHEKTVCPAVHVRCSVRASLAHPLESTCQCQLQH